jgi:hypothetical protein
MSANETTILYGDVAVPVHSRSWKSGPRIPYKKTYSLKPGQHWKEAGETPKQSENYVLQEDGTQIPVGALIAKEFLEDGAECAYFIEMWHGVVFVGPDLVCVDPPEIAKTFLKEMKHALGNLRGLPDAIGFYRDGKIRLHEAKHAGTKDKLQPSQHHFAKVARSIYGGKVEFGVTEWGYPEKPSAV